MKNATSKLLHTGTASLALALATLSTYAYAQDAAPAADEGDAIIVTGSRIARPDLDASAPLTVVTAQDIKLQGTARVEDLLNSMPSIFASQASTLSNGSD